MTRLSRVLVCALAATALAAPPALAAAPAKRTPAAAKAAPGKVAAAPKLEPPPKPLDITCGAPIAPPPGDPAAPDGKGGKKPRKTPAKAEAPAADPAPEAPQDKKGKGGKTFALPDQLKTLIASKPKLPDKCVLSRFLDPAFPVADPNAPGRTSLGLFGGGGPIRTIWPAYAGELQGVADSMARLGPRPDVKARIIIAVDDRREARSYFEGAGGTGGVIVLTEGLADYLQTASSKDDPSVQEFAWFIIAHEYAHLVLKHPQQLDKAKSGYDQLAQAFQVAGMAYMIGRSLSDGHAPPLEQQQRATKSAGVMLAATFAGEFASVEGSRLLFPGFSKSVERDADLLAVDILVRAHADPLTGASGLKKVYLENKDIIAQARARREQADKTVAEEAGQLAVLAPSLLLQKDKDKAVKDIKTLAMLYAANFALKTVEDHKAMTDVHMHDAPEQRAALVGEYVKAFYGAPVQTPDVDFAAELHFEPTVPSGPPAAPKLARINFKKVGAEVEAYRSVRRANDALVKGDTPAARAAIDIALKSPIAQTEDVQQTAAAVAAAEGKWDQAIKHYRNVLATGYEDETIFNNIALLQRTKGDDAAALKTLEDASAKLGDPKPFIVNRIVILRDKADAKGLAAALEQCRGLNDAGLVLSCERAALPPEAPTGDQKTAAAASPSPDAKAVLKGLSKLGIAPPAAKPAGK